MDGRKRLREPFRNEDPCENAPRAISVRIHGCHMQSLGDHVSDAGASRVFSNKFGRAGWSGNCSKTAMPSQRLADVDKFFAFHLQTVKARLERNTERAIERQKAEWREAVRREALLEEKQNEMPESR